MSDKLSLGQSIVQAVKFLEGVFKDIGAMVKHLDEAMEKKKWLPVEKNISEWLSNSLDPINGYCTRCIDFMFLKLPIVQKRRTGRPGAY